MTLVRPGSIAMRVNGVAAFGAQEGGGTNAASIVVNTTVMLPQQEIEEIGITTLESLDWSAIL
jgi:hypothetical protein